MPKLEELAIEASNVKEFQFNFKDWKSLNRVELRNTAVKD
jgi:hypothetical protein